MRALLMAAAGAVALVGFHLQASAELADIDETLKRGATIYPVTTEFADVLAESGLPDADSRDWEACTYDARAIYCPDGYFPNPYH